jgi:hypothetical protein
MFETIGEFNVQSHVEVSDPCYSGGGGINLEVLPGKWVGKVRRSDEGDWGNRVATLRAHHVDHDVPPSRVVGCAGVDSGQMSIADASQFNQLPDEHYDLACQKTLGKLSAGIVEDYAVVSSSGYGDGGYDVKAAVVG